MSINGTTILHLPDEVRERLDWPASERKQSRSHIIIEAIERYLDQQQKRAEGGRFAVTRSLLGGTRSGVDAQTIDARIRAARDDD